MAWMKLTKQKLQLLDGSGRELANVPTEPVDSDTLALDVPLDWLRSNDAPTQLIISLDQPSNADP